jgi:hypothetical protein
MQISKAYVFGIAFKKHLKKQMETFVFDKKKHLHIYSCTRRSVLILFVSYDQLVSHYESNICALLFYCSVRVRAYSISEVNKQRER